LKHIWKQVAAVVDPTLIEMPFTVAQHMQRRANTMRSHISASARDVLETVYGLQGSAEEQRAQSADLLFDGKFLQDPRAAAVGSTSPC
jgi:hypothetical protein